MRPGDDAAAMVLASKILEGRSRIVGVPSADMYRLTPKAYHGPPLAVEVLRLPVGPVRLCCRSCRSRRSPAWGGPASGVGRSLMCLEKRYNYSLFI